MEIKTLIHGHESGEWNGSQTTAFLNIIHAKAQIMEKFAEHLIVNKEIALNDAKILVTNNIGLFMQFLIIGYLNCQSGKAQLDWLLGMLKYTIFFRELKNVIFSRTI